MEEAKATGIVELTETIQKYREENPKNHRWPLEIKEKVNQLQNEGFANHQISRQSGLAYTTVTQWSEKKEGEFCPVTVKTKRKEEKKGKSSIETRAKHLNVSGMAKAIDYSLNRWNELTRFIEDVTIPLTNNDAERAIRHSVMGRKNFNGSKTINGADVAANLYTLIESCKKVYLQPKVYLKYLVECNWYKREAKTPLQFAMESFNSLQLQ